MQRQERGFSLPELLIVIALMGLFILFGGPAFMDAYRAYRARATADNLLNDLRAQRYIAVANRASSTLTLNNQSNVTAPNTYSFTNSKGVLITITLEPGVNIETTSAGSVTFGTNGGTGASGNTQVMVSCAINSTRNDRYTITITPTGTVSSAYSTF